MIKILNYIESIIRNRSSRIKGMMLKIYLLMHGCKVGKGLKCASFPYFKGFPNKNITIGDFVDLGRNVTIELTPNCELIFEDYVLLHQNILISCNSKIIFRKWSGVAENTSIRDGSHKFDGNNYFRLNDNISQPIEIGEGAGIAAGCVVLMGAKISKGAFIGSNSVITRKSETEEYGIYAGNPLKLIGIRK
jgi:acetyltransferase-like isoleucine patch superfamily enzyme